MITCNKNEFLDPPCHTIAVLVGEKNTIFRIPLYEWHKETEKAIGKRSKN